MSRIHGGALDRDPRALAALVEARERIAEVAKRRRAELGMTQETVAEALGCSVAYYQRIEYAQVNLTLRLLTHLVVALECELEDMLQPRARRLVKRRSTTKKAAN